MAKKRSKKRYKPQWVEFVVFCWVMCHPIGVYVNYSIILRL